MKNKKNIIIGICWIIDIILLLVMILIPKNANNNKIFFRISMLSLFLAPLILIIVQTVFKIKNKEEITLWNLMPTLGSSLIMLLTFVKFIGNLEKQVVFQTVVITLTFISLLGLISYVIMKFKNMTKKQYIFINVGIYLTLILFLVCLNIMSYDWGI